MMNFFFKKGTSNKIFTPNITKKFTTWIFKTHKKNPDGNGPLFLECRGKTNGYR